METSTAGVEKAILRRNRALGRIEALKDDLFRAKERLARAEREVWGSLPPGYSIGSVTGGGTAISTWILAPPTTDVVERGEVVRP